MKPDQNSGHLRPGTPEYDEHVAGELHHYGRIFADDDARRTLVQPVPPSWSEVERRAGTLIESATGRSASQHVISRLQSHGEPRLLSLGSGPGGVEIAFAQSAPHARITCIDLNADLLELGRARARALGLTIEFLQGDLNTVDLPADAFDFVWCHAALHHVLALERLAAQVKRTLRADGELLVVDVITANGYRMWPETRGVVRQVFASLPEQFRVNHTAYGKPGLDKEIWEADTSTHGMECVRSEDILHVLAGSFEATHYVPYFSIARRFLDTMYGPNYDLSRSLDTSLVNWIWELDRYYLENRALRPETYFGIYRQCRP